MHINQLEPPLSTRARNILLAAGWTDVDQARETIAADGGRELLRMPYCGRTIALEICAALGLPGSTLTAYGGPSKDSQRAIDRAARLLEAAGWHVSPPRLLRDSENMGA